MASWAISVFPLAVGIAAITFSPSQIPASTVSACGGYNSVIPARWKWAICGVASGNESTCIYSRLGAS